MTRDEVAWKRRILRLLSSQVAAAKAVLKQHGFTADEAMHYVRASGPGWVDFARDTPGILRDRAQPAFHALHLLLLENHVRTADPLSVQVGRLWRIASIGCELPAVAKSLQVGWLQKVQGPGGRKENDLTRTLRTVLREMPSVGWQDVVEYLQSDAAADRYHYSQGADIHVHTVELDEENAQLTYQDRSGYTRKVKVETLKKKDSNCSLTCRTTACISSARLWSNVDRVHPMRAVVVTLLRLRQVWAARACGKSALYKDIQDGLFTRPVKIGSRASAWPGFEVEILNRARIADKSIDEIKELVMRLTALRATLVEADEVDSALREIGNQLHRPSHQDQNSGDNPERNGQRQ